MKHIFIRLIRIITDFLFPSFCALCGEKLLSADEIKYGLCLECKNEIKIYEGEKCNMCGKPLVSEINTCLSCRNKNPSITTYDRLWVLYPYSGKYRELLAGYKFQKTLTLANFFAEKIRPILDAPELKNAFLVPVPPHPGKIKKHGWDQVDYLVKKIILLKPNSRICRCLKRQKSLIQKELNREDRFNNIKGRIYVSGSVPKNALVIDDVTTTGATIEACAAVLKEAGAAKVYGLCLFYD